jgi:hypothetical protein
MNPKPKQKPFFERFEDGKMKKITPAKYEEPEMPAKPTFDLEGFAKAEGLDMKELQDFIASKKAPKQTAQPKPMTEPVKMEQPEMEEDFGAPIVGLEDEEDTEEETQQQEVPENFTSEEIEELFSDSNFNWQMLSLGDNEAFYQTDYETNSTDYIVDIIIKDGEVRFDAYDLLSDEEVPIESSTPISMSKVMNSRELDFYLEKFLNGLK